MAIVVANVRLWHLADNPAAPAFVRYWSNSGQIWILTCDGLSAYDPMYGPAVRCKWILPSWR